MKNFIITLDGPSGSGKTTVAKKIAEVFGIAYLDTGAMYRAVGYYCNSKGVDVADEKSVENILDDIHLEVVNDNGVQKVIVNGEDVTGLIRTGEVSMLASTVSKIPSVRKKLVEIQRAIARTNSCVLDGRDIGSYVLPDADYKFYMTADVDVRAKRRYLELKEKKETTLEIVKQEMIARDEQDSSRAFAPLCVPNGAYVIDTTNMAIEEVIDIIKDRVNKHKK
ncbi:MAG: (d)CMP kinase [Clostridiales bacterium]|nr:(d)CMP kinase [Clostridiales bacterium]